MESSTHSPSAFGPVSLYDSHAERPRSYRLSRDSTTMGSHRISHPQRTSSLGYRQSLLPQGYTRKLQSQYPANSDTPHVEFILVASFNIGAGAIMEHQYPGVISPDEHMLADLMLPDQMHNRSQDWTIFFLHKETTIEEDVPHQSNGHYHNKKPHLQGEYAQHDAELQNGDMRHGPEGFGADSVTLVEGNSEEHVDDDIEEQPLIYVLNLVNTKYDSSAKRGAIVKAMAICTRHPFLHIYKPLLLLALDEYFKNPVLKTLATLYDALNSMDLSLMPKLSYLERSILQASNAKDLFVEKFRVMLEQRKLDGVRISSGSQMSFDGSNASGARPIPRDTHEYETRIMYNGISVPVKVPTARSPEVVGDFSIIKLIQTFSGPHSQNPQPFALHPQLTTGGANTHPIIVLVNALLTQKRIMFMGHNKPSGEVAEAVLAACALASGGLLRGFTRHAFPYTDLTKIDDLLKIPGFIAGVTNQLFANKTEWWDLLCDLTTGRMKISTRIEQPSLTEGLMMFQQQNPSYPNMASGCPTMSAQDLSGDAAFMDAVLRNINNRLGEQVIRGMWRDWVLKFTRITAAFEESVYGTSALHIGGEEADAGAYGVSGHGYVWSDETTRIRELVGNVNRFEAWRTTRSYYCLIQDHAIWHNAKPISAIDLHYQHDRLRTQKLHHDEAAAIYLAFAQAVHSTSEVCQLLTITTETHGGLFYISLGLLHPRKDVRYRTMDLLDRIMNHEAGKHFWASLGRFAKMAFFRVKREAESALSPTGNDPSGDGDSLLAQGFSQINLSGGEAG